MVITEKKLFTTEEELIFSADQYAKQSQSPDLEKSTKLYFITRYLVAVYETIIGELPIQVWNEYRNALDHFFRSNTASKNEEVLGQLSKMEGHLQRAALDASKYIFHDLLNKIEEQIKKDSAECLRLVSDGKFFTQVQLIKSEASEIFQLEFYG